MEYKFFTDPVPFCVIHNFYTPDEVSDIHKELSKLKVHFGNPDVTGAARNVVGESQKENSGIFLDSFYGGERDKSVILQLNRKIFSSDVTYELAKGNWFFKYLPETEEDTTLVSYYEKGNYYKSHEDQSFLTAIYYTWKEPKTFEGGDLYFGDFKVPVSNNCMLIFPSKTRHRVSEITEGQGRYAISQFVSMKKPRHDNVVPVDRFEHFLSVQDFTKAHDIVFGSDSWSLTNKSLDTTPKFWSLDLSSHPYFTDYLFNKIRSVCKKEFKLKRVYANGQTFGQDGSFHQDDVNPDTYTFLLYMNSVDDEVITSWGGETQFRYKFGTVSFFPVTNSALLFSSQLWHRGTGPSRHVYDMRVTVAWKMFL